MNEPMYSDELGRALARPDANRLCQQIEAYAAYFATTNGDGDWPEDHADDFMEMQMSPYEDPDKALAYVVIGAECVDDTGFVAFLGCGPLEDLLRNPSTELLERIVAEAERSD